MKYKVETGDQEAAVARCRQGIGCKLPPWSPLAQTGSGGLAGLAADAPGALWV